MTLGREKWIFLLHILFAVSKSSSNDFVFIFSDSKISSLSRAFSQIFVLSFGIFKKLAWNNVGLEKFYWNAWNKKSHLHVWALKWNSSVWLLNTGGEAEEVKVEEQERLHGAFRDLRSVFFWAAGIYRLRVPADAELAVVSCRWELSREEIERRRRESSGLEM